MPMRLRLLPSLAALLVGAPCPSRAAAQLPDPVVPAHVRDRLRVPDSARVQVIALRDGTRLVGRIAAVGADTVRFVSATAESSVAVARRSYAASATPVVVQGQE